MSLKYNESAIRTMAPLEHIRKLPQMYVGDIHSPAGHVHLIKELLDNSADEASVSSHQRHIIDIVVVEIKGSFQIIMRDTGRGIPLGSLTVALTEPRTSGKWSDSYNATTGVFGIGAKATTALSRVFCGISRRPEGEGIVTVREGIVQRSESNKNKHQDTGMTVFFEPDGSLMRSLDQFFPDGVNQLINLVQFVSVWFNNATFRIFKSTTRVPYNLFENSVPEILQALTNWPTTQVLFESNGTMTPLQYVKERLNLPEKDAWSISFSRADGEGKNDIADRIGYNIQLVYPEGMQTEKKNGVIAAVNRTRIEDPTSHHILGVDMVLKEKLSGFIEDSDVRDFFMNTYKLPMYGVINVSYKGAVFVGQTKDQFKDKDFFSHYYPMLLKEASKLDPSVWQKLIDLLLENIETAYARYRNKSIPTTGLKNIGAHLNKFNAYDGCFSTDPNVTELFIAEGASAGGQIAQIRNTDFQAVFSIQGKSLNTIRSTLKAMMEDDMIKDLSKVIGIAPGSKDLSGLNFKHIIILTDADSDGHHITCLLIGLLYKLCPLLLQDGRVLVGSPPLYTLSTGKTSIFLRDINALLDVKISSVYQRVLRLEIESIASRNIITLADGSYRDFCYMIDRIGRTIERVANTLVIDPGILEQLVHCVDWLEGVPNTDMIKQILGLQSATFEPISNSLIMTAGSVDITIPLTNLAKEIRTHILPELREISFDQINLYATTLMTSTMVRAPITIYQVYRIFQELDGVFTISRYKGLGELKGDNLRISSIDPNTRSTYSIREIGDVDKLFAMLGVDTSQRKLLVEE